MYTCKIVYYLNLFYLFAEALQSIFKLYEGQVRKLRTGLQ
jgi:hypothetical protein